MFCEDLGPVVFEIHRPEPGKHLDAVGMGDRNDTPVVVGRGGIEHDAVDAYIVHFLAGGFERFIRAQVKPCPEERILGFGFLFSAGGQAEQGCEGYEQEYGFFHEEAYFTGMSRVGTTTLPSSS